ncbi:hypothetical protein FB446DRAFT_791391 [Lentinula raphanica]|nr:hypothetical protein FB446DRAFT_791391 [Lentinula raphanica]
MSSRAGRKSTIDSGGAPASGCKSSIDTASNEKESSSRELRSRKRKSKTMTDNSQVVKTHEIVHLPSSKQPKQQRNSTPANPNRISAPTMNAPTSRKGSQKVLTHPVKSPVVRKPTSALNTMTTGTKKRKLDFLHSVKPSLTFRYKGGRAPVIRDSDDENEEVEAVNQCPAPAEDDDEDSGKDEEMEMELDALDERRNDQDASAYLSDEAVQIIPQSHDGGRKESRHTRDDTPSSLQSSHNDEGAPLSISSSLSDIDMNQSEDDKPEPAPLPRTKKAQKQMAKLAAELPIVTKNVQPCQLQTTAGTDTQIAVAVATVAASNSEPAWLQRTDIVLEPFNESTRSFKLSMNGQSAVIKGLISAATKHGCVSLVHNAKVCGLTSDGLNELTFTSLLHCSDVAGYDGALDISDRLESGDHQKYIKPLIRYVSQRISLERRALKSGYSSVVLTAFGIDHSVNGIQTALDLVMNSDYIYPPLAAGGFDYDRAFCHDVVHKYLTTIFTSSIPDLPLELEVPKAMLAMTGCVIHAILLDHAHSKTENFPPTGLEKQFDTFMEILTGLEKADNLNYHRMVHKIYRDASRTIAPATHGLSKDQILSRINFTAFKNT